MPSAILISYIILASISNQSGILTVLGRVKMVFEEPEVNLTLQIPSFDGVKFSVETSPQIYLVLLLAVIITSVSVIVTSVVRKFNNSIKK